LFWGATLGWAYQQLLIGGGTVAKHAGEDTFDIGAMVTVIRALNLGPTAAGAKSAEHAMAIAGMFFTGIFAGTILFGIIRALRGRYARTLGLALGIAAAVPVALISHQAGQTARVYEMLASERVKFQQSYQKRSRILTKAVSAWEFCPFCSTNKILREPRNSEV
jgi:hypothetical protein